MPYRILADAVVFVHSLWIVFLISGAVPGRKSRAIKAMHISGLAFALVIQIFDWYCPFTHLEVWLRERHEPGLAYPGSFISHYAEQIVYVELSRPLIAVLSVLLCAFNAWFYLRRGRGQ